MEKKIRVTMLGKFTLCESDAEQPKTVSLTGRSRRLWTLVAYLILHRERGVSAQELIDLLWPEASSDNPLSTLQNNVSRARAALEDLGLSDAKHLIYNDAGMYRWAPRRETWLDCDEFQKLAQLAMAAGPSEEGIRLAREAIELYTGDFLPESAMENWCINVNTYYRSLYIRLCRSAVQWMFEQNRLSAVEKICSRVIQMDPAAEEFSVFLMRALIRNRNPEKALEHYEHIRQLYRDTYGVTPSEELEMMKSVAVRERYGADSEEENVKEFLFRSEMEEGAFCCDNNVFREIVKLRLRDMKRTQIPAQLLMIRLKNEEIAMEKRTVYMRQLESTLQNTLRSGDPYTRLGPRSLLALLPGATTENGYRVVDRVMDRLRKDYPRSGARYTSKVLDLSALYEHG